MGQCHYSPVPNENAKAFEMEGRVLNRRQPEAQAPTLGIWPQYIVGQVVPLSQKGLSPPTCQSLGLEEVPPSTCMGDGAHCVWCVALKAACAFEAHLGFSHLPNTPEWTPPTISLTIPMQTASHE